MSIEAIKAARRKLLKKEGFLAGMSAEAFNAKYPVGTPVRYFSLFDAPDFRESRTRSPAWTVSGGNTVVSIDGTTGGVALDHLKVIG